MTSDRWTRVRELFEASLDIRPGEREAFLDRACAGDAALRAEVASLLASHDSADRFLETPAAALAPDLINEPARAPLVGRRLGPYLVRDHLGQGGMGVVYLAEDTRLGRLVALKALAPQLAHKPQHRERLQREARLVAALSHSGIATVYALEEIEGESYIASEYVPGVTLREEAACGPLAESSVIALALEVARILAAAHEQGVIHRDLKPENVMRATDGRIKILDFGLARLQSPGTVTVARLTETGSILGTPAYMSPEQIRGLDVDFRTDLFSLGTMLYELATAVHPFAGSDPASTIARVLERDPPEIANVRPLASPGLSRIVRTCLRKDPGARYQSTPDLVRDLEMLARTSREAAPGELIADRLAHRPSAEVAPALSPLWWWQVHQVTVGTALYGLLIPLWLARGWMGGPTGAAVFFGGLAVGATAATLRLHLWFASRFYREELRRQHPRTLSWVRAAEGLFIVLLLAAALVILEAHAAVATVLIGAAVVLLVTLLVIEPATTRAAFRDVAPG